MSQTLLDTTLDLLETLVRFDTTSHKPNRDLIEFVRSYLTGLGAECELIGDTCAGKFNLYATIGPRDRSGLCLSGHTDVVPVDRQAWTVEPFALTRQGDRLLGRGVADMKGFLAAVLAAAPNFVSQCAETPIHLAFSYDEETGCRGVGSLLDRLSRSPFKPLGCIVGEPTGMRVSTAHKGKLAYCCQVRGRSGHSALPNRGVNAVEVAAELVSFLRRAGRDLAASGERDERFDPPWTTVHVGTFRGGTALNVIPDRAEFEFEIRHLPQDDPAAVVDAARAYAEAELLPAMHAVEMRAGVEWRLLAGYPALDASLSCRLSALACECTGDSSPGTLSFGTEAGLFQAIGIPAIVCGPGSIEQAHKADEFIEVEQLERCLDFLLKLARQYPLGIGKPAC